MPEITIPFEKKTTNFWKYGLRDPGKFIASVYIPLSTCDDPEKLVVKVIVEEVEQHGNT